MGTFSSVLCAGFSGGWSGTFAYYGKKWYLLRRLIEKVRQMDVFRVLRLMTRGYLLKVY